MATLTGQYPKDTYKDLLQVSNSNSGVDSTLRDVSDGEGTASALQISSTTIAVNGISYPTTDGTANQVVVTDGAGTLSFATIVQCTTANVDSAGAVMNTDTTTASMSFVVDEDNMVSDSATKVPTQQSVKAYVDTNGGGSYVLLDTQTASAGSSIDLTTGFSSLYACYHIILTDIKVGTDGANVLLRTSTDGGSTFDSGASDYIQSVIGVASSLTVFSTQGAAANEIGNGTIKVFNPSGTEYTGVDALYMGHLTTGSISRSGLAGYRQSAADVDAIRIFPSTGTITGTARVYGLKAT